MEEDELIASGDSETSLPRGAIDRLVKENLPPSLKSSPDAAALLNTCLDEFLQMLAAEANETCNRDKKTTITEQHLMGALGALGFERYTAACMAELHKEDSKAALKVSRHCLSAFRFSRLPHFPIRVFTRPILTMLARADFASRRSGRRARSRRGLGSRRRRR